MMTRVLLWVSLCLLSACAATPQSRALLANFPDSLPAAVELTDTPFFPQTDYQCGPAALATVLQSHHVNGASQTKITPDELVSQVYLPGREGSLQIEMVATARRYGMLPYPLAPQLADLLAEVAAGNPVLVMQNLALEAFPQWHYAVVIGYDLAQSKLLLRSGTTERWVAPFEVFERTWQRADFWALVIVPLAQIPSTATPDRYLQTAYAFEELQQPDQARKAYQAATKHWPVLAAPWLMLGNLAFSTQDLPTAVNAFWKSVRLEPSNVAGWNNLAYALEAYGCGDQVKLALSCAQEIAPQEANVQDSARDLLSRPLSPDHSGCPQIQCAR